MAKVRRVELVGVTWTFMGTSISCGVPRRVKTPWTWRVESPVGLKVPVMRVGAKVMVLKVRGFEFVFQHAVIADGVAALAAEGVDDDGAGGFAGSEVEGDLSLLDVEGALDGVEAVGEGEVDFAVGGVEGEFLLGLESSGGGGDEKERSAKKVARNNEAGWGAGRTNRAKGHSGEETPSG